MTSVETPRPRDMVTCMADVLEGKADAAALAATLASTRQEIALHRQGFAASLEQVDPVVQDKIQASVLACQGLFDAYDEALTQVDDYLRTLDRNVLQQAAEHVKRLAVQLSRSLQSHQEAVLIAQGPTNIANYNQLLQAVQEWKNGPPNDRLNLLVERERNIAQASGERLDPHGSTPLPAVMELRKAFQAHFDIATRLAASAQTCDVAAVETELELLRDSFTAIRHRMPAAGAAVLSQGPSPSGPVNLVVNTGRQVAAGHAGLQELAVVVGQLKQTVQRAAAQFEVLSQQEAGSPRLQPVLAAGRQAFARYEEGFSLCKAFFTDQAAATLKAGMVVLLDASQQHHTMQQALAAFQQESDAAGL